MRRRWTVKGGRQIGDWKNRMSFPGVKPSIDRESGRRGLPLTAGFRLSDGHRNPKI